MVRHHDMAHLVQRLGMRKQRRRMAVVAHPQQDQIERRRLRAFQLERIANASTHTAPQRPPAPARPPCDGSAPPAAAPSRAAPPWSCGSSTPHRPVEHTARPPSTDRSCPTAPASETAPPGSASSANIAFGVVPPEIATRAIPRAAADLTDRIQEELRGGPRSLGRCREYPIGDSNWTRHSVLSVQD